MADESNNLVSLKEYMNMRIDNSATSAAQRFDAQQLALKDALISQEKAVAAALEGTKEAIIKNDANTDKRFDLLSEKIGGVVEAMNKNAGAQAIYVTHSDLASEMEKLRASFESMLRPVITFMNNNQGKELGASNKSSSIVQGIILGSVILGIFATVISLVIKFV